MKTVLAFIAFYSLLGCDSEGCHQHRLDNTGPTIRVVRDSDTGFHFQWDAPLEEERVVLAQITSKPKIRNQPHAIIRKDGLILTFQENRMVIHDGASNTIIPINPLIVIPVVPNNFTPRQDSFLTKPRVIHEEDGSKNVVIDGRLLPVVLDEEQEEFCENIIERLRNSESGLLKIADCLPSHRVLIKFDAGAFRSELIKAHSFGFDDWYGVEILKASERARLTLPHRFAHANRFEFESTDAILKEHPFKPYRVGSPSKLRFEQDNR